jgi:hypothetical protein
MVKPLALALALALSLLGPLAAHAAPAATAEPADQFDAVIVAADDSELADLLASGQATEYSIVSAADLGLDEAALAVLTAPDTDALLPAAAVGLDGPERPFIPAIAVPPVVTTVAAVTTPRVVPAVALRVGAPPIVVPAVMLRTVVRPVAIGRAITPFGRVLVIRRF